MSVANKKRARALRARYGVASGVVPADGHQICQVINEPVVVRFPGGGSFNAIEECENIASLVEGDTAYCTPHWAKHKRPAHR